MKIENITVGATYKNWKALCEVLGVEPKSGSYKQKQERDFKQYFNWEKNGQKITITEIYEVVQEREDGRGKSESSLQALKDNRANKQPKFKYDDELQLMILLYLANRTYAENERLGRRSNVKYNYCIACSSMYTQTGLCSNYYTDILSKDGMFLIGTTEQIQNGVALYTKSEFREAFRDFYKHMQHDTRTALENLRKRKVLDYVEVKSWFDGQEWHECGDYEMQCIVEAREDTIDWWNATHTKQLKETYDLYNQWTLTQREKDEAFDWMHNRLKEMIGEGYVCHTSSFKVYCSQRAIERHLDRIGFIELLENEEARREKIQELKTKNLNLQLERTLDKERVKHIQRLEQQQQQEQLATPRRGFGKRKEEKIYVPLANDEIYNNAKELLKQGIFGVSSEQYKKAETIIKQKQK